MIATTFRIGADTWATSLPLPEPEDSATASPSPTSLHFVVDNSASMGTTTDDSIKAFSPLIDSAASAPCSVTLFAAHATLLSASVTSSEQMTILPSMYKNQGMTNIPAGVRSAVETIALKEKSEEAHITEKKTHHILILLTDGIHNIGPGPNVEFPKIGDECRKLMPNVQLSVVVVGITRDSSTSMGMLLKTSIETVPLDSEAVKNIYFAASRNELRTVTSKLVGGLNVISTGKVYSISHGDASIIAEIGLCTDTVNVRVAPKDRRIEILLKSRDAPDHIFIDGNKLGIMASEQMDYDLVSDILRKHIDKIRVKRVAMTDASRIRPAISILNTLVDAVEEELGNQSGTNIELRKAHGADRLAQYRKKATTMQLAKELRNQIADIANFSANSSEEQAAFLTGSKSKFASKAWRRAAARSGDDVLLDPKKELARVQDELQKQAFAENLHSLLRIDTLAHLSRLSEEQRAQLQNNVKTVSTSDFAKTQQILALLKEDKGGFEAPTAGQSDPGEKVVTSALCWIPPEGDVRDVIQSIRQKYDKQINRWPPHVDLLYPFVPSSEFGSAAAVLAEALQSVKPFDVSLRDIEHFSHGKSCTAWLHPEETDEFVALQAACQAVFPHCSDLTSRGGFVPHMTVGQFNSVGAVNAFTTAVAWQASPSRCGEICLISRTGKEPFEVHWLIELGSGLLTPMSTKTGLSQATPATPNEASNTAINKNEKSIKTDMLAGIDPGLRDFVDSGALAGYLNDTFFGDRKSYLSLSNPWEHIAEWKDLSSDVNTFQSQWEMLMYAGALALPITVERSAASQMNPFQLLVTDVHTTTIDTASLCCANQSEIDTYGPEGGAPIQDGLVLIDPSCPRASAKIASSALLGETYTSVVVSRDLHMYTGASMKIALLGLSLFRSLQPEPCTKSKSNVVADIRREFLGRTYQCASCGFGPVDHEGCSDLFAHHLEELGSAVASNACPSCGWFAERLNEWDPWDGVVPDALIEERAAGGGGGGDPSKPLQAKMDVALRIIYSFRKQFLKNQGETPIQKIYSAFVHKLVDWDLDLTTQDGVDGLVQLLIAVIACDGLDDEKTIESAFSPPVMLAIVNEACGRAARKKFRMAAGENAETVAVKHVTEMLHISEDSAPTTKDSLLEPEPSREAVRETCSGDYYLIGSTATREREWVQNIAQRWCTAFGLARALRKSLVRRGGGWKQLERDMETSIDSYNDVIRDLQDITEVPSFLEMCDITPEEADRTLTTMAAQAFLCNKGAQRHDHPDVRYGETLRDIAKDIRMGIYAKRVGEKMKQWVDQGEELAFCKARVSDISQYLGMIQASTHVHGLSKEMFWGLWEAAICDGADTDKVMAFLETANQGFRSAHAPENGGLTGKKHKRNRRR